MGILITTIILICINLLMWIIFSIKFKNVFSTDDIIEKTRKELNHMIADVNRNADRNITLIENKIQELKSVTAEADRHLKLAQTEFNKAEKANVIQKKISASTNKINITPEAERYIREQVQGSLFSTLDVNEVEQKIPVVTPKIFMSDNPVEPQKDFNTIVKEKYKSGLSIEEIASELSRSIQEVKFVLEFSQ